MEEKADERTHEKNADVRLAYLPTFIVGVLVEDGFDGYSLFPSAVFHTWNVLHNVDKRRIGYSYWCLHV